MKPNVLVIGANGMVGRAVTKRLRQEPVNIKAAGRDEIDLMVPDTIVDGIFNFCPDYIFICGAYTNVDAAERDPHSYVVNVEAVKAISELASKRNIKLIFFSTSYVFSGRSYVPYSSHEIPSPMCEYGRQKLAGEMHVLRAGGLVIRTVGVFGEDMWRRNFVHQVHDRLALDGQMVVATDQMLNPIWSGHLADHAVSYMNAFGVHHVIGDQVMSKYDFAIAVRDYFGWSGGIQGATTRQLNQKAKRPKMGALEGYQYSLYGGLREMVNAFED